jgi:chemotaxis protein MotA
MDIATIIGLILAGALVMAAIVMGGSMSWFVSVPSLMIVLGGTIGATLISYPLGEVLGVFKVVMKVFLHRSQSVETIIQNMVEFGKLARK